MRALPTSGTILAPASNHLQLYHQLFQANGPCSGLQVLTLETFVSQLVPFQNLSAGQKLFEAAKALETLDPGNTFASSFKDADFLRSILDFQAKSILYGAHGLKPENKREQDLKDVLDALSGLLEPEKKIRQSLTDQTAGQDDSLFQDLYILDTEYTGKSAILKDMLLEKGARLLRGDVSAARNCLSAANIRKCMEVCARDIIEKNIAAQDVLIVLADDKDRTVCAQILDSFQIPYTFLHPQAVSHIPAQFASVFQYLARPGRSTWLAMITSLYPATSKWVREYYDLFETRRDLHAIDYQDNAVISPKQWMEWLDLEDRASQWEHAHSFMKEWSLDSLEQIAQTIQNIHAEPTREDIQAMDAILSLYAKVKDHLKSPEEIELLARLCESVSAVHTPDTISGVRIGNRKDLSCLEKHVYYIGPHAGLFPNLEVSSGLLDETIAQRSGWPSLSDRLAGQRKTLYSILDSPESLTVILPQSDYSGRSLQSSFELEKWLDMSPAFQSLPDISIWTAWHFAAPASQAYTSLETVNSLQKFKSCPLKHYLQYGLHLKKPYVPDLSGGPKLIQEVLRKAVILEKRTFAGLEHDDLLRLVETEYAFARQIFPAMAAAFDSLVLEQTAVLENMMKSLKLFETDLHLKLLQQEMPVPASMASSLSGSLNGFSYGSADFTVYGQTDGQMSDPVAGFRLDCSLKAAEYPALKVNYRKVQPEFTESRVGTARQEQIFRTVRDGFTVQDLPENQHPLLDEVISKKHTFAEKQEILQQSLDAFLAGQETIEPVHEGGACKGCPYSRICRNASSEKEKEAQSQ